MKRIAWAFVVLWLALTSSVYGQTTISLTDTSHAEWTPDPGDWGTLAPVVSYHVDAYLKAQVTSCTTVGGVTSCTVTGNSAWAFDVPRPATPVGIVSSPPLKPMVPQPGTEYVLFVIAVGPTGSSGRSNPSDPFGTPGPPRRVQGPITIR